MRLRFDATAGVVGTAKFTKNSHDLDDPAGGDADNGGRRTGAPSRPRRRGMRRLTGGLTRALVVVAVGLSFGVAGVVGEAIAQSETMKKDEMKKEEMQKKEMMKKKEMQKGETKKGEKM